MSKLKTYLVQARSDWKNIRKINSLTQAANELPFSKIEVFALLPASVLVLVYLKCVYSCYMDPYSYTYPRPVYSFFREYRFGYIFGYFAAFIVLLLYIKKISLNKGKQSLRPRVRSYLKNNTYLCFFIVLYIIIAVSPLIHGFTKIAFLGDPYRQEEYTRLLSYPLVYMLPLLIVRSKKKRSFVIYSFIIVSVIIAALDLFKYVFFPKLHENTSLIGIFCQINHYGYFLTMMISASAVLFALESNKKLRMLNLISFIMNTVALGINSSLGPQLSTFFALIFAFVVCKLRYKSFNKDIIFLFVIYILIMLGISFFIESFFYGVLTLFFDVSNIISGDTTGSEGTGRLRIWEYTVKHIAKRPLLGYGIEGLTDEMIELNLGYGRPHNEFLQYAEFYGIPAAIIYFIGCFMIFIKGLKLREKLDIYHICAFTVVFAYLVSSAVGNTMYYTTPLFFIFIGLACSVRADLSDSK